METILITVIIPIYNCEKYLRKCLTSVLNQSLEGIEVILINDGSSDGSQTIIEECASVDRRVISIELKKNRGVSVARNTGIEIAKGEYIIFLDADDSWSDNAMLEILLEAAVSNNADVVNFGLRLLGPKDQQLQVLVDEARVVNLKKSSEWHFNYSPVRHLFLRKLINDYVIRFDPDLVMGEDCLFNITFFCYASRLVIVNSVYYNYQISMNSANTSTWSKHKLSCTMLWFERAIQVIIKSPAYDHHPRLLQELILERLKMLTQKLLSKALVIYDDRELSEYIDLCARSLTHIDNAFFDDQIFPTGWPALPRNTVDMILNKDLAGLRTLYSG